MNNEELIAHAKQWLEDYAQRDEGESVASPRELCEDAAEIIESFLALLK